MMTDVTAIWRRDEVGWRLLAPTGFPDEATLHRLVQEGPQILPLAGSPRLTIVGHEVLLGSNYADLIAVEPTGRLVVIEIKLARNAEARRAVIAQVLTYAAYLRGMDSKTLQESVLGSHLRRRNVDSLATAIAAEDQEGTFDQAAFADGLDRSLQTGHFRLVVVLDEAPQELVRLAGYLDSVADKLTIDLITVSAYEVGESKVLVPQRVDPEKPSHDLAAAAAASAVRQGVLLSGVEGFEAAISTAPEASRPGLARLCTWAKALKNEGLVNLFSYQGSTGRWTLLPRLPAEGAGLVTIWNDRGPYLSVWRSVFERCAPLNLSKIEQLLLPDKLGQGTTIRAVSDDLLQALTDAYREAARREH